jgi:hypothetical protein
MKSEELAKKTPKVFRSIVLDQVLLIEDKKVKNKQKSSLKKQKGNWQFQDWERSSFNFGVEITNWYHDRCCQERKNFRIHTKTKP